MANSIFRLTLIFLVIFAVANGRTHQTRRYGNDQETDDSRRSQDDGQQIVDNDDVQGRRSPDQDRPPGKDQNRRNQDNDQMQHRRRHVRNKIYESPRPTTRDKRHVRVQKTHTRNRDRREREPERNINYVRNDQDVDRNNQQDKIRMFIHGNKHKQRRLRNHDRRDRNDQGRNGNRNQERTYRNERREQDDRSNRNWNLKVQDRKDRRDQNWDRGYRLDWDRINRYALDRRGYDHDRQDQDWVFRERLDQDQDYDDRLDQYDDRHDQYDDRRDQYDDRRDQHDDRNFDNRDIRHHDLREQYDERVDQYLDRRDRNYDRRDRNDDRKDRNYDQRDRDDDDDDDDDYNDRRDQDYERTNRHQTQRDNRYNQYQDYARNSDIDEQTRRFIDYTERLRIQGNQNNHWLQYSFRGDDFPKKNYNLQLHRLDIIQPDVKNQEIDPKILPWQEEPWNRNVIKPTESVHDNDHKDHFLEVLKLLDKSTKIVLKSVHNVSTDSNHALEILNVLDNLADQGICNPSEAHYDWIYSTAVPIAVAEVKLQPARVAEKIKQKVELSHLAIADLRDLIETVSATLCQGEAPDNCNVIIQNAVNDSPSREILDRQMVYLKHISTLARIFADYMPEFAEVAKSNQVMAYFNEAKARTWPLVNRLITARLDAGAAQKKCFEF